MNLFLIGAGIGIATLLAKGAAVAKASENVSLNVASVKWKGWKNGALNFDTKLSIQNPTAAAVNVNNLLLDIHLENGAKITTINRPNWNQRIEKEDITTVSIPVKLYLSDLISVGWNFIKLVKDDKRPKNVTIKGSARLNGVPTTINETVKVL